MDWTHILVRRKHVMAPLWGLPKTTGLAGQKNDLSGTGDGRWDSKKHDGTDSLKAKL